MKSKEERISEAKFYLTTQYCGLEQYKETEKTVKDYPEEFPWHTKYNSFPDSVHEAYTKEREDIISANKIVDKPHYKETKLDGQGLTPWIKENEKAELTEEGKRWNNLNMIEQLDEIIELYNKRFAANHKIWRKLNKLWKKHYGSLPYGDSFREDLFGRNYNF